MLQKKHLIIFDIDGTLINTGILHPNAFEETLQQMGIQGFNNNFGSYQHLTDSYIAKTIYEKHTRQPFDEAIENAFEDQLLANLLMKDGIAEIAGAAQMLTYLEDETNYAIAFATGSYLKPALYKLHLTKLPFTDTQLVACNGWLSRADIVKEAIAQAQEYYQQPHFEQVISIGDGLWDLQTAKALDLPFIGVGLPHKKLLLDNGAKVHINDWRHFDIETITSTLWSQS